ncbi:MAG: diaminopimelate epimerase [Geodermatophilaceae bacterium]|nr:diaminopimelate epimerase [Geodermatophilaceae bacterium]
MTRFLKGHGTENDFILLPDLAKLDPRAPVPPLTAEEVRRLCDRHAGIGANGVLRVLPVGTATEAEGLDTAAARWFMDYRNADGSASEMCGNGARLFARYLRDAGLETADAFDLATRGGVRGVSMSPDGEVSVDMGPATSGVASVAEISGARFPGQQMSLTNPHLVCLTDVAVDTINLSCPPVVDDGLFPDGVNVEFANLRSADSDPPRVRMRVHERGVGETRSCGTGACAVAAHVLARIGRDTGRVLVEVTGGELTVSVTPAATVLSGPAVFVATGDIDPDWWTSIPE